MSDERPEARPEPHESWIERLLGRFGQRGRESMRDDIEEVLSDAAETGDLSARERLMLKAVLGFHRIRVSDVMVPRADIVAVSSDTSLGDVLRLFRTAGHSRLPAYGETLDEPLGMIHIRDFLDHIASGGHRGEPGDERPEAGHANLAATDLGLKLAEASILRPVLFVPRSMPAIDLLARMQASRTHMALVIDEYGGTDGLVSIEDLVETVVGDIEDEHDETESMIVPEGSGSLLADARAGLDEISEALSVDLATAAPDEVDTLGGFIVTRAGRVPSRGEILPGPFDLEFEVLDADPRRLKRVRVQRKLAPSEAGPSSDTPTGFGGAGPAAPAAGGPR